MYKNHRKSLPEKSSYVVWPVFRKHDQEEADRY